VTWRDAIALARRSVGRRGGRAVLTVLAVALGAALLSSLLIASTAAKQRVLDQVSEGGPLSGIKVDAAAPSPVALDSDNPRPGPPRRIDDAALRSIARLPDVVSVLPIIATPMVFEAPAVLPAAARATDNDGRPIFDSLVGVDLSRINDLPVTLLSGRLPELGSQTEVAVTSDFLNRIGMTTQNAAAMSGRESTRSWPLRNECWTSGQPDELTATQPRKPNRRIVLPNAIAVDRRAPVRPPERAGPTNPRGSSGSPRGLARPDTGALRPGRLVRAPGWARWLCRTARSS